MMIRYLPDGTLQILIPATELPPAPCSRAECRDALTAMLSECLSRTDTRRNGTSGEYFPLSAADIRELVSPQQHQRLLLGMIANGILEPERQRKYMPGWYSKGYRLSGDFVRGCDGVQWHNVESRPYHKRVAKWTERVRKQQELLRTVEPYATLLEALDDFTVDEVMAVDVVSQIESPYSRLAAYRSVAAMSVHPLRAVVDVNGRLHTELTRLKREVRHAALLCRGQPTVEIDVANCQPLLLAALLRGDPGVDQRELAHWQGLAQEGALYDELAAVSSTTREKVKQEMLWWLYSPEPGTVSFRPGGNTARTVSRLFPTIHTKVEEWRPKVKGVRLCDELQTLESQVVLPAATRLVGQGWGVGTVHDSVITVREAVPQAEEFLRERFVQIGLIPTLRWKSQSREEVN